MGLAPRLGSLAPGAKAAVVAKPITQTRKTIPESRNESAGYDSGPQGNKYTIYDLKTVKREILTVFDAAENGDNRAITKFSKIKNFDVDAKVLLSYLSALNVSSNFLHSL